MLLGMFLEENWPTYLTHKITIIEFLDGKQQEKNEHGNPYKTEYKTPKLALNLFMMMSRKYISIFGTQYFITNYLYTKYKE